MLIAEEAETRALYVYKVAYSHIKLTLMDKDDVLGVVSVALDQGHDVTVRRSSASNI